MPNSVENLDPLARSFPDSDSEWILVRFGGDLTTKAKPTRLHFVKRLIRNLKDALRSEGVRSQVHRSHDRVLLEVAEPGYAETLARVYGVQSLSKVDRHPWTEPADIVEAAFEHFRDAVRDRRFAVRARRVGDRGQIDVKSQDIERELGTRLLPLSAGVDLRQPEVTASLEIAPNEVRLFGEALKGPGGLPLGVEGRAVALVSGGFDSAVAVWQMQKRGVAQDYVFCNLGGRSHQLGTLRVMKEIAERWSYGTRPRFHAVDFDAVSRNLQANTRTRYWQIVLKRLMYRAAELVAAECRGEAIITGEAVGQVSSQTLTNLAVISRATEMAVLRPLVGYNKDEILDVARHIGTFDLSKVVGEYCAIVPSKPATAAALREIEAEEVHLDPTLVARAVQERSVFDLRSLDLDHFDSPELVVAQIPEGATVIDLRSKTAYRGWHYRDSLFLDFAHALEAFSHFDREKTYVLYCEFGLKSAHLAEQMRQIGIEAYHLRNGLKDAIEEARRRGYPTPDLI